MLLFMVLMTTELNGMWISNQATERRKAMKWIKMMNKMFAENPYTDDGRVTVDYAPNSRVVVIKAFDKVATINVDDGLTEYGLMWAVMVKVKAMYN